MTAEAAAVFPLFLMAVSAVLSFFPVLSHEMKLGSGMAAAAKLLAVSEDPVFEADAPDTVRAFLQNGSPSEEAGGISGLVITASAGAGESALREITVQYGLNIPFFQRVSERFRLKKQVSLRAWKGKTFTQTAAEKPVYVTEYGRVYHTSLSCSYLSLSVRAAAFSELETLRNTDGHIYYPCEICADTPQGDTVYITAYGTRWHRDRSCAGLRRGIRMIPLSETGSRPLCSRCRERDEE